MKGKKRNVNSGKAGKFLLERLEAGRKKLPAKWQLYQRKNLKHGKKGRRNYPWRKMKGMIAP